MNKFFQAGLLLTPITIVASLLSVSPAIVFILSAIAIIPLAKYIGESTEMLTSYTGPALGGLLNATFGNATELIIGVLALQAGLIEVVKASITGSVIGNILLVLGMAMFMGGTKHKSQKFTLSLRRLNPSTLFLR